MKSIWDRDHIGDATFVGMTIGGVHTEPTLDINDFPGLRAIRLSDGTIHLTRDLFPNPITDPPYTIPTPSLQTPVGAVIPYAGSAAPTDWLLCNGASLLRADYPALFTAIGTTYGAADATHFTLPDLRAKFPVGVGTGHALAATGGAQTVALTAAQVAAHNHGAGSLGVGNNDASHQHPMGHTHDINGSFISDAATTGTGARLRSTGAISTTTSSIANTGNQSGPHSHAMSGSTSNAGGGEAHENRPPYLALNFIIRASGVGAGGVELLY